MSSISVSLPVYGNWYQGTGYTQAHQRAINSGRQQFHTATEHNTQTQAINARIADAVISSFTTSNALVERWPAHIRRDLNQATHHATQHTREFDTWARPRDLEKRKQAVSVWTSLLAFIVFHWHQYGADGALEAMGLELTWQLKDVIDTIRDYAEFGRSRKVLSDMVRTFFSRVIMNTNATAQTNPLVWWLAVLIQTEVLDDQPRWCVAQLRDSLDFPQKLEAIDHYARVLILDHAFYQWINDTTPQNGNQKQKEKVVQSLDRVSLSWIDQDRERPAVDFLQEAREISSPDWQVCTAYVGPILTEWLTDRTVGPMSVVIKLLHREELFSCSQRKQYCVKVEIYEDYTIDPCMSACYPALVTTEATIKQANKAAREYLREELGSKRHASKWDEVHETGGMIRIRAIYQDDANNAKAIVWVEEILVDGGEP